LGGRHVKNKKAARENWLRAAAIMLWKDFPSERDKLVKEARQLLNIRDRKALAKLVDNFDQKYDPDSPTPVGIHFELVKELCEATGWRSLKNY